MKSIFIACALAAGTCLYVGAQPLAVTLHPEACAPVATADGSAHLLSAPAQDRMSAPWQSACRQAPRKATGETTWKFKNYDAYQKVGDEWVQTWSITRKIDPVTGYVPSETAKITEGIFPDNIHTHYQLVESEYDEYGRRVLYLGYMGDTPDEMTLVVREITEYFKDTTTDSHPKSFYSQTSTDNGVTWQNVTNSRIDVEYDAEGRVIRVADYYYAFDDNDVWASHLQSDASIVYGADNRPAMITIQFDGYKRIIRDIEWGNYNPEDIYGISLLRYDIPKAGSSWCSHAVFTNEEDMTRVFSTDMTVDGTTTTVNYTRILKGEEKPATLNEVAEGTYIHYLFPERHNNTYGLVNTYKSVKYYVPGEETYQSREELVGSTYIPDVRFRIEQRSVYPAAYDVDGNLIYYCYRTCDASKVTFHEDSGMVYEYITTGESYRGEVDVVGDGLPWYIYKPIAEWPEVYNFETILPEDVPYKRVYTNWVKATDAIGAAEVDDSAFTVEWYTIDGCRVANPSGGIFIRRQGTQATKVLLK